MKIGFVFAPVLGLIVSVSSLPAQTLSDRPKEMLAASMAVSDAAWDDAAGLLWSVAPGEEGRFHRVRESSWYALGLLMRGGPGDEARALRIVAQVLDAQLAAPGEPWDGTFRRAPEEPLPGPGAKLWKNFDPNWRQFIGTTFALMLEQQSARIPETVRARMLESIRRAVAGELTEGRAEPYATNIKLLHGFLLGWAGRRLERSDWVARSEAWIESIRGDFARHETFEEYNSPTYYGVDLYGLALCRRYGATEKIRAGGAGMEAALWRDIGRFYHPGLKNLCGPFDRAYGMDMRRYVSLVGTWMGLVLPAERTPLPAPSGPMGHAHDFAAVPLYVALGARVPDDVLPGFREFQGERLLRRPIEGQRVATAWLAREVMIGGELTGALRAAGPDTLYNQYHPATIHWRAPGDEVGWVNLWSSPACDAQAEKNLLTITAPDAGDFTFHIYAPGISRELMARERWTLPGLSVEIASDAKDFTVTAEKGVIAVSYRGARNIQLRTSVPAP